MRISECAELTGTTVRTIRYYHQIGLLPVPPTRGGRRGYQLTHVARILRIRWLVDAGLSLDAVADILRQNAAHSDSASPLSELTATAQTIDQRIAELTEQRERISALITMAEEGRSFTPVPREFTQFYDRVAERLTDPEAREALRKEQRLGEMLTQRGLVPAVSELAAVMAGLDDRAIERAAAFYTRYPALAHLPPEEADQAADELRAQVLSWAAEEPELTQQTIALLPRWGRTAVGRKIILGFTTLLADSPVQARMLRALIHDLLPANDQPDHHEET